MLPLPHQVWGTEQHLPQPRKGSGSTKPALTQLFTRYVVKNMRFLGIFFIAGKEQYYNSRIRCAWALILQGKTTASCRTDWWVAVVGAGWCTYSPCQHCHRVQRCQNCPICSEVLMDKALGRRNGPWSHSCLQCSLSWTAPDQLTWKSQLFRLTTGAATRDKFISFSENTGVSSFSWTAVPLSTQNTARTSRAPALPEHLQRYELADAIAKGSQRNQGCDTNCVTKTQTPSLQVPKVSGSRPQGRADFSWSKKHTQNSFLCLKPHSYMLQWGFCSQGNDLATWGACSKQNSQQRLQGFSWSVYGLKCAEPLVQHIKGGTWVNVNAEQPSAQAEVSSGAGGPDPDWGGEAHRTAPGRAKMLSI